MTQSRDHRFDPTAIGLGVEAIQGRKSLRELLCQIRLRQIDTGLLRLQDPGADDIQVTDLDRVEISNELRGIHQETEDNPLPWGSQDPAPAGPFFWESWYIASMAALDRM